MTPLHLAAKKGGRSNIVNHLVDKGANVNIQDTHFGVSETILLTTVQYCQFKFLVHVNRGYSIHGLLVSLLALKLQVVCTNSARLSE